MAERQKFAALGQPHRVWAIASIHAQLVRLRAIHDAVGSRFRPGDRLVYLGNMIGGEPQAVETVAETVDEILSFRRALLSLPGMFPSDIVYLRGSQEEMWQKLLQLQLAPNPGDVLSWMAKQGASSTLATYGGSLEDGMAAARGGAVALARWTAVLRANMQAKPGHATLYNTVRRAAYTSTPDGPLPGGVLFVNAGIDPSRSLDHQGDRFWWLGNSFASLTQPFSGFQRVVRGYDPMRQGVQVTDFTTTLDAGGDQNGDASGPLVCGVFSPTGEVLEMFQI